MSFEVNLAKSPHEVETTSSVTLTGSSGISSSDYSPNPMAEAERRYFHLDDIVNDQSTAAADSWINLLNKNEDPALPITDIPNDISMGIDYGKEGMTAMISVYHDGAKTYTVSNIKTVDDVMIILEALRRMSECTQ